MATHEDELVMAYIAAKKALEDHPACHYVMSAEKPRTAACVVHEGGLRTSSADMDRGCSEAGAEMDLRKALVDLTKGLKLEVRLS